MTISPNGTLIIKSVTDQDAGVYKCLGDKQEYIAELKIVRKYPEYIEIFVLSVDYYCRVCYTNIIFISPRFGYFDRAQL